jgi:hypothetical protein
MALTKIKPDVIDETLDYSFDNITANSLSISGSSNLNSISNVKITGGSSGQFISTDGLGNLSFTTTSSGSYANGAFAAANTADQKAVSAGSYANSGFDQANTANTNAISAGSYANGAFTSSNTKLATSGGTISGDLTISGNTNLQQSIEKLQTITGATGTVAHNFSLGSLFYHSSISANFTANITNVPSTNDRVIVVSLILIQGATAYIPSALQIDGTSQTINWSNGTTPTGNANKRDLVVFSLVRTSSTWTVLGQLSTFG